MFPSQISQNVAATYKRGKIQNFKKSLEGQFIAKTADEIMHQKRMMAFLDEECR